MKMLHNSNYEQLVYRLCYKRMELKQGSIMLPGNPYCLLESDDDLEVMLDIVFRTGIDRIDVYVIDCSSHSSGISDSGSKNGEFDNGSSGCQILSWFR